MAAERGVDPPRPFALIEGLLANYYHNFIRPETSHLYGEGFEKLVENLKDALKGG